MVNALAVVKCRWTSAATARHLVRRVLRSRDVRTEIPRAAIRRIGPPSRQRRRSHPATLDELAAHSQGSPAGWSAQTSEPDGVLRDVRRVSAVERPLRRGTEEPPLSRLIRRRRRRQVRPARCMSACRDFVIPHRARRAVDDHCDALARRRAARSRTNSSVMWAISSWSASRFGAPFASGLSHAASLAAPRASKDPKLTPSITRISAAATPRATPTGDCGLNAKRPGPETEPPLHLRALS